MTHGGPRPGAGRKPRAIKSVTYTLRLEASLHAWVAAEAERTGRTRARVVNDAVAQARNAAEIAALAAAVDQARG